MRRVLIASGLWALVMAALGFDRYATYHAGADMGLFTQTLFSAFADHRPFSNTLEGANHFTYHFSPILYLFAPFVIWAYSGWPLIVIQAIAGALVAPPLYRIARRRLDERTSFVVAVGALLYPPLVGVTFTDFHEAGLLPAATLWLLDALDARRFVFATAFAVVCLATRDDQGLILGFLGIFAVVYFARKRERAGIVFGGVLITLCAVVFVGYFAYIRPLAGGTDGWHPLHFYNWDTSSGQPLDVRGRFTYLLEAFGPLVFVPFVAPVLVLALPGFAEVLGSHESLTYTMGQHYPGVWVGFVLFAFALGLARIAQKSVVRASRFAVASLAISLLWLAVASPTHWGHFLRLRNAHDAVLDHVVDNLTTAYEPGLYERAVVGSYDELYAHLGVDPCAFIGVVPKGDACRSSATYSFDLADGLPRASAGSDPYVVYDPEYDSASMRDVYLPQLRKLVCRGTYVLDHRYGDVRIYVNPQHVRYYPNEPQVYGIRIGDRIAGPRPHEAPPFACPR
jgi:uncharacterized membrane protein